MSDSSRIHVTFMSFSTKQSSKQFHGTFSKAYQWQSWTLIMTILSFERKCFESAMKVTWIWFTWEWQVWSAMNLPWKWHETVLGAMFGVEVKIEKKVAWKCHESAMKVPWKWHESDMNMTRIWADESESILFAAGDWTLRHHRGSSLSMAK